MEQPFIFHFTLELHKMLKLSGIRLATYYPLIYIFYSLCSCSLESDFNIPQSEVAGVEIVPNSDLNSIIQAYLQSDEAIFTFPEETDLIAEAIVISSDEAGNFYKTLIVQDLNNEPMGLAVKIDLRAYYTRYDEGRKVYLNTKGLSMTSRYGSYILGYRLNDQLTEIPEPLLSEYIFRTDEKASNTTLILKTEDLHNNRLNTRVRLENYQFEKEDLDKTFAGEVYDSYNALRAMTSCLGEAPLLLSTSIYSDFKSAVLPPNTFDLEGILIREYSGELAIVISSPEDIEIRSDSRCDPDYLGCNSEGEISTKDKSLIFYESFEDVGSTKEISNAGWTNINMNFGNGKFVKRSSSDNTFLRISSYGSKEVVMEVWLISPPIDLTSSFQEELSFETRATFNKGRLLSVWLSNDYNEDPWLASWKQIDANISDGTADGSNELFTDSGKINLDCIQGEIRIAFRYAGGDPSPSTTYDLDNILIKGFLH